MTTRCCLMVIYASAGLMAAAPSPSQGDNLALGRHLAGQCVSCHPRNNRNVGIPGINGWAPDKFVAALKSYKTKERGNPVMQSIAANLSDEEMAALAAYFTTLKPEGG